MTFTDTSTDSDGTIASRAWDLDDDGAYDDGTGATAARSFPAAGTYTVRLQVTDDDGAPATRTRQVTVSDAPPPNSPPTAAFTVSPASPQTGQAVTFTDGSTDADGTIARASGTPTTTAPTTTAPARPPSAPLPARGPSRWVCASLTTTATPRPPPAR